MNTLNEKRLTFDSLTEEVAHEIFLNHLHADGGGVQILVLAENGRSELVWRDLGHKEPMNEFGIYRIKENKELTNEQVYTFLQGVL